jgi:HEAT repeat protein
MVAVGALTLACVGDPNDPQTWIKKLHDPREQHEALRNLVRLDDKVAVQPLLDLYKDPRGREPEVLDAILHFHDPRAVPMLIDLMDYSDQDFDAAAKAAAELGRLKAREAIPALTKALDKPLPVKSRANLVKQESLRALSEIGGSELVAPLCKMVKALPDDQDIFLNKVAALALGKLGDARAVPCLLYGGFISRADGATFFQDVRVAIAKIGAPAVPPLIELLDGKNEEVSQLARKLDIKPQLVVHKAAYLLGDLRGEKAVPALMARWKTVAEPRILVALGQIGDPAGLDAVMAVLKDGKQPAEARQAACDAVLRAHEVRALPLLVAIAKDGKAPAELRLAAGLAVGRLGGKAEAASFSSIDSGEKDEEVKRVFDEVVERLDVPKACTGDADDCYVRALDDKKLTHQEKAAYMLGAAKDAPKALRALTAHVETQEPVVRLAIVDSMRRLAARGACASCATKLQALIGREEKLTTKLPAYRSLVDEMSVTLAAIGRGT